MREVITDLLAKKIKLDKKEILNLIEIPPDESLGDYAFPCFRLASLLRKNPVDISTELANILKKPKEISEIEAKGPYLNFFINKKFLSEKVIKEILNKKESFGKGKNQNKTILIDMSSPNIAKPFGIGHLRSTIIGNSIAEISKFQGYKVVKINYLGDWGTQFGKLILGWKKFGNEKKLKQEPVKHLLEIYVKANKTAYEQEARGWFKKLEYGDKEAVSLWKKFRELGLKDFEKIYKLLNIKFDVISGESFYNKKLQNTIELLKKKNLLKKNEGAQIVDLEKYNLGVALIQKSDEASLYATRDITAAIDRHKKYKFYKLIYETGSEQKLHFQQAFKILELLGFKWYKECIHIPHGLYLDEKGKKFATRKGKTIFMEDILDKTIELAKKEIQKREKVKGKELEDRARKVAVAAIFYGDLKNYRTNDIIFDIERFLDFEGDTGPYLLYSYARASSIIRKAKKQKPKIKFHTPNFQEYKLVKKLANFPEIVNSAYKSLNPSLIANYSFQLAQIFNEFYHSSKVIGSEEEAFRLALVKAFRIIIKQALSLLGIDVIERM